MKNIYCFAGPNGSGKSTIFKNIVDANQIDCEYINPDIIATMEPFSFISDPLERNKKVKEYVTVLKENINFKTINQQVSTKSR